MKKSDNINRRKFLQSSLIGSAALLGGSSLFLSARCDGREQKPASSDFAADIEIELTAAPDEIPILPGQKTQVWRYRARVLKGSDDVVQNLKDTFTGQIFRLQRGQKVRVHFKNEIPDKSIVHWHGLHVPEEADGHPRFVIKQGQTYIQDRRSVE